MTIDIGTIYYCENVTKYYGECNAWLQRADRLTKHNVVGPTLDVHPNIRFAEDQFCGRSLVKREATPAEIKFFLLASIK